VVGPVALINDMRPTLNDVNKNNPHLESYVVTSVLVRVDSDTGQTQEIHGNTWLDFGLTQMTVDLPEQETILKFPYHLLKQIDFSGPNSIMTVLI
jgi:hypothetical protein